MITAKITLTGAKPTLGAVTIQACVAKDLGAKKYETPKEIVNDAVVSFYCKADDCNVAEEITKVLKEDVAKTLEAMKAVGHAVTEKGSESEGAEGAGAEGAGAEGADGDNNKSNLGVGGAAQTTVAVATIAFFFFFSFFFFFFFFFFIQGGSNTNTMFDNYPTRINHRER